MYFRMSAIVNLQLEQEATIACNEQTQIVFAMDGGTSTITTHVEPPDYVKAELESHTGDCERPEVCGWFIAQLSSLRGNLERAVRLCVWRAARLWSTGAVTFKGTLSSTDGVEWSRPRINLSRLEVVSITGPFGPFTLDMLRDAESHLRAEQDEPLCHQLLREASQQLGRSNRSALILGIASAEVAVKSYIAARVPASAWLVENLASPPIHKMVKDYIETLPPVAHFIGKPLRPPSSVLKILQEGVEIRNKVVHSGNLNCTEQRLREILSAVADLIHIFDVYSGARWAAGYVRGDTLEGWRT